MNSNQNTNVIQWWVWKLSQEQLLDSLTQEEKESLWLNQSWTISNETIIQEKNDNQENTDSTVVNEQNTEIVNNEKEEITEFDRQNDELFAMMRWMWVVNNTNVVKERKVSYNENDPLLEFWDMRWSKYQNLVHWSFSTNINDSDDMIVQSIQKREQITSHTWLHFDLFEKSLFWIVFILLVLSIWWMIYKKYFNKD